MDAAKAQLDLRRPLQSGGRPWRPPHDVYVAAALVSRACFTRAVIHAALQDLLGTAEHPPAFASCGS